MKTFRVLALCGLVGAPGCATAAPPPIANTLQVSDDALSLQYILDQGCLPYALGDKSGPAAMRGLGLTKVAPYEWPMPNPVPYWRSPYPGVRAVHVTATMCSLHVSGDHLDDYRKVTVALLHDRLGADAARDAASTRYPKHIPGLVWECARNVAYQYGPSPGSRGWGVTLFRGCP